MVVANSSHRVRSISDLRYSQHPKVDIGRRGFRWRATADSLPQPLCRIGFLWNHPETPRLDAHWHARFHAVHQGPFSPNIRVPDSDGSGQVREPFDKRLQRDCNALQKSRFSPAIWRHDNGQPLMEIDLDEVKATKIAQFDALQARWR